MTDRCRLTAKRAHTNASACFRSCGRLGTADNAAMLAFKTGDMRPDTNQNAEQDQKIGRPGRDLVVTGQPMTPFNVTG